MKLPVNSCVAVGRNLHRRRVFERMANVAALSPIQALVWILIPLNTVTIERTIVRYCNCALYMFIVIDILYILYDNNLIIWYYRIFKRQPTGSSYQMMQDKSFYMDLTAWKTRTITWTNALSTNFSWLLTATSMWSRSVTENVWALLFCSPGAKMNTNKWDNTSRLTTTRPRWTYLKATVFFVVGLRMKRGKTSYSYLQLDGSTSSIYSNIISFRLYSQNVKDLPSSGVQALQDRETAARYCRLIFRIVVGLLRNDRQGVSPKKSSSRSTWWSNISCT